MIAELVRILLLSFVQNVSFSVTSRARNRDSQAFHLIAAIFSNGVWFLTFRELILADFSPLLFTPYCVGTVTGSLSGVKFSMWVERLIGATSDSHVKTKSLDMDEDDLVEKIGEIVSLQLGPLRGCLL